MDDSFPILLAEDNPVSRKVLEKILVKAGHEVTSAENGREALRLFQEKFFPIVLTDWMMPEMNGVELCKAIRDEASQGYVFIVLLTARDSKNDIVSGLEAGADDYLIKPPHHAELLARIKAGTRILKLERSLNKANEEIRILSITDPLTGSYNRGYLTERLPKEIIRAKRYDHPLSIVLCDIDHFKKVNDTYGHQAGDQVLKDFVACIEGSIRSDVDWVARYGGEEFIIAAPEADFRGAFEMAERLRKAISQREIKLGDTLIRVKASFGVTGFGPDTPVEIISPEAMINKADEFLYRAKLAGRDRVVGEKLGHDGASVLLKGTPPFSPEAFQNAGRG